MGGHQCDPFELPTEPRTGRELLWWTVFEWPRLYDWSKGLNRKRSLLLYLRAVPWMLLLSTGVLLLSLMLITALELPLLFPAQFKPGWVRLFEEVPGFGERLLALLASVGHRFVVYLALGLAFGLAGGLAFGLALGLGLGLAWGLVGGLVGGLAAGLAWGLTAGLGAGVAMFSGWLVGYLRLPFYLPQALLALVRLDLRHNPYLYDTAVGLPIWGARRRLTEQAYDDPGTGTAFGRFLLRYRPLQRGLAAAVLHAAHAGRWRLRPLAPELLSAPPVPEDQPDAPGRKWLRELAGLRRDLEAIRTQTQVSLKREAFGRFAGRLDAFAELTLLESPRWNRWYLDALEAWSAEAEKEGLRLADEAASLEPIAANVYRTGTSLRPESDKPVFFGRDDLREALAREILTAAEMPLLLVLGQRRVGKTSLLNFLPELLGGGFCVVAQDLQDDRVDGVTAWIADLRRRTAIALERRDGDWEPPEQWLAACRACIEQVLSDETPSDRPSLMRLEEQGFIVRDRDRDRDRDQEQGRPRLRVPLFEDWLRKYREGFPSAGSAPGS